MFCCSLIVIVASANLGTLPCQSGPEPSLRTQSQPFSHQDPEPARIFAQPSPPLPSPCHARSFFFAQPCPALPCTALQYGCGPHSAAPGQEEAASASRQQRWQRRQRQQGQRCQAGGRQPPHTPGAEGVGAQRQVQPQGAWGAYCHNYARLHQVVTSDYINQAFCLGRAAATWKFSRKVRGVLDRGWSNARAKQ